ncbi:hypothetical protein NPIL_415531 [Nephila pilipes]|uniref:Uncharacterized protein n=1 Tax=Nephila pilipes TaxID=299642 RepID=A0A8X6ICH0_NEPPI|nr:hypothetical protein NPIL_415531 [Nephila pilipes]
MNEIKEIRDTVKMDQEVQWKCKVAEVTAERDVVKAERDVLKTKEAELKMERDVLKTERDMIKKERDGLLAKIARL